MKKIYSYIILLLVSFCWVSCNNEWEDEQYEQYGTYFNYWTESNPSNDFPALNANRETKSYIWMITS